MTHLETLESAGIGLGGTGDIMIEENMFEELVQKTLGVNSVNEDYADVDGYGEVDLKDSTFYCNYASDNGFLNLGCWVGDDNFVFHISEDDFKNQLKNENKELYNTINNKLSELFDF